MREVSLGVWGLINEVSVLTYEVRARYVDDVRMYLSEGYSEHDCVEINSLLAEVLRRCLGIPAKLVSVAPLLDYEVKHYAVLVEVSGQRIIADAVPELTGLIPEELPGPLIMTEEEYRAFFLSYLQTHTT